MQTLDQKGWAAFKAQALAFAVHRQQSEAAKARGDTEQCLHHARAAAALKPEHVSSQFRLAQALHARGHSEEAQGRLRALLQKHPRFWQARWLLTHIAVGVDDYAEAAQQTEAAMVDMPRGNELWPNLASLQWQAGDFEAAETSLVKAQTQGADPASVAVLQTRIAMAKGEWETAKALVLNALDAHPQASALRACAVESLLKMGELDAAGQHLFERVPPEPAEQLQWCRLKALLFAARYAVDGAVKTLQSLPPSVQIHTNVGPLLVRFYFMQGAIQKGLDLHFAIDDGLVRQGQHAERRRLKHGFIGGLATELGSNQSAVDALAHWRKQCDEGLEKREQRRGLEAIVQAYPRYLGLGMIWLNQLRQTEGFRWSSGGKSSTRAIALRIVQFWDSPDIPEDIQSCMQSWVKHHPHAFYECFNDETAQAFLRRHAPLRVRQAFREARHPAMRADLFRIAYLVVQGGIYADSDDVARCPTDHLLEGGEQLVLLQEDLGTIGNNWIAAVPQHPWLIALRDHLVEQVLARQGGNVWFTTGPAAVTHHFTQFYGESLRAGGIPEGCRIVTAYELSKSVAMHLPRRYKSTAKHWVSAQNQLKKIL